MRRPGIRFFLTFLAGAGVAALVGASAADVGRLTRPRYEDLILFTQVLKLVSRHYVETVEQQRLVRGAVRGLLQALDPHSYFLDPDAFREIRVETQGKFHGLGIEIARRKDGSIEVVAPIESTPAARAGIRAHDQIVAICPAEPPEGCRSSKNLTLFEIAKLLRGKKGTTVTIELFREGFDRPRPYTLVRDVVKIVSVSGRMLEPHYAYIRIRAFQDRTRRDLKGILEQLHEGADGRFEGLVLDLRDNPGGLLDQAVRVADAWLTDGLVVYTEGRVESRRHEFRAHTSGTEPPYSMAILVNAGTASSSEIVAGALQDRHRALVIGVKTFGKGSVQTVYPLEAGAGLRLTTALYYTPSGRSIQEVGIAPDIVVEAAPASRAAGDPTQSPEAGQVAMPDVQLNRALEVLKSWTYFERLKQGREAGFRQARARETAP